MNKKKITKKILASILSSILLLSNVGFTFQANENSTSLITNEVINTEEINEESEVKDEKVENENINIDEKSNRTEEVTQEKNDNSQQNDINNLNVNAIFERYYNGEENAEDLVNLRKSIVEKNHWQNFVDKNYFLLDSFYSNKSGAELSTFDIGVSTKPTFNINSDNYDEVDSITPYANVGNGFPVGTIGTNTQTSQKVGWDASGWNDPTYTNIFYTSFNGIQIYPGFCGAHDLPGQYDRGQQFRIAGTSNNIMIRKAVYYGYGGADGKLRSKYSIGNNQSPFAVYTALTISDYMGRNPVIYSQKPNAYTKLKEFINDLNSLPAPPSHFKAYVAEPLLAGHQPLVFLGVENPPSPPGGTITIEKRSADPQLTNGSDCYSLGGAKYGVWRDKALKNFVGDVTTALNSDKTVGIIKTSKLRPGTYYIKEITAPKGFAIDPKIYPVTVTSGQNTTLKVKDTPKMDPVGVLLRKVDSKTKQSRASVKTATLEGAEFTFKLYKGNYETDPALQGQKPVRSWVFRTDKDGYTYYDKEHLINGDELYISPDGFPSLPIGTITIQETKSPEGFLLNDKIFVIPIKENGSVNNEPVYVEPVIPETLFSLNLVKKIDGTEIAVPNAVFEHTSPKGIVTEYTTDVKGKLSIEGLERGVHTIKEKSTPDGFILNKGEVKFRVNQDNSIEILSNTSTDETGKITLETQADGNLSMVVNEKLSPFTLQIVKENNKHQNLQGAEFTLSNNKDFTDIVDKQISNDKGGLKFKNLKVGKTYYLRESKAPKGYKLPINADGSEVIYEISTRSNPVNNEFVFIVNGKEYTSKEGMFTVTGTLKDRISGMTIVNTTNQLLPNTGSNDNLLFLLIGIICVVTSITTFFILQRKNNFKFIKK